MAKKPKKKMSAQSLYKSDFHAWCFQQAELIKNKAWESLDIPAIFINSSQDSGERGKAGSKRSGPHDDAIAEGSMAEEEDRSGKAAAGRSPDEFMKVAEKACLKAADETALSLDMFPEKMPYAVKNILKEDWFPD